MISGSNVIIQKAFIAKYLLHFFCSDLFWDQHYRIKKWPQDRSQELVDTELHEYELPEQVEKLIEGGKYKNVEQRIKKVSEGCLLIYELKLLSLLIACEVCMSLLL